MCKSCYIYMICIWYVCYMYMICIWYVYDMYMICIWYVCDMYMICIWYVYTCVCGWLCLLCICLHMNVAPSFAHVTLCAVCLSTLHFGACACAPLRSQWFQESVDWFWREELARGMGHMGHNPGKVPKSSRKQWAGISGFCPIPMVPEALNYLCFGGGYVEYISGVQPRVQPLVFGSFFDETHHG